MVHLRTRFEPILYVNHKVTCPLYFNCQNSSISPLLPLGVLPKESIVLFFTLIFSTFKKKKNFLPQSKGKEEFLYHLIA